MRIALLHAAACYVVRLEGSPIEQTRRLAEAIAAVSLRRDDISHRFDGGSVEMTVRTWTEAFTEPEPLLAFARRTGALEQGSVLGDDDPDGHLCAGVAIRLLGLAASYSLAGGRMGDLGLRRVDGPIWMVGWGATLPVDLADVPAVLRKTMRSVAECLRKAGEDPGDSTADP